MMTKLHLTVTYFYFVSIIIINFKFSLLFSGYNEFDALFLLIALWLAYWATVLIQELRIINLILLKLATVFYYEKVIFIVPPDYPESVFSFETLENLQKLIDNMKDALPDNDPRKSLITAQERGILKITFFNKKSKNFFILTICEQLKNYESFLVVSDRGLPNVEYGATIKGKKLNGIKIKQRINKFNEKLINTSLWHVTKLQEVLPNIYKAVFLMPAKEYLQVKALNNVIKFGYSAEQTISMELLEVQGFSTININGCEFEVPFIFKFIPTLE